VDLAKNIKIVVEKELSFKDVIRMIVKLDECLTNAKVLEQKMKEIRDSL